MEVIGKLDLGLFLVILKDWTIGWVVLFLHVDLLCHFYYSCPAGVGSAAFIDKTAKSDKTAIPFLGLKKSVPSRLLGIG